MLLKIFKTIKRGDGFHCKFNCYDSSDKMKLNICIWSLRMCTCDEKYDRLDGID